jgi:hypothetical protein
MYTLASCAATTAMAKRCSSPPDRFSTLRSHTWAGVHREGGTNDYAGTEMLAHMHVVRRHSSVIARRAVWDQQLGPQRRREQRPDDAP